MKPRINVWGRFLSLDTRLTFGWSGGQIPEEADCHFQNVGFLQLGVARAVFANKRQNQTLQMVEAVVDASAPSLLQQRFQSLGQN